MIALAEKTVDFQYKPPHLVYNYYCTCYYCASTFRLQYILAAVYLLRQRRAQSNTMMRRGCPYRLRVEGLYV